MRKSEGNGRARGELSGRRAVGMESGCEWCAELEQEEGERGASPRGGPVFRR